MNKIALTILILLFTTICKSQTTQIKYYDNRWLEQEVPESKAKFSQAIIQNSDGSVTTEIKNIKRGEVVQSETYKGEEPYGIWKYQQGNGIGELDFSFDLKYADVYCKDSIEGVSDYFSNNDSLKYVAPIIEGDLTFIQFLVKNFVYPPIARENGITGRVIVAFTLTDKGNIEDIVVLKGVNTLLDKEAVRVMRQLKFKNPPSINGITKKICFTIPIRFQLD